MAQSEVEAEVVQTEVEEPDTEQPEENQSDAAADEVEVEQPDDEEQPVEEPEVKESELEQTDAPPTEEPPKEQDTDRMQNALIKIDQLLDQNTELQSTLTAKQQVVVSAMEDAFAKYVTKMKNRLNSVKSSFTDEIKEQTDKLLQQQEKLQRFRGSVKSGIDDPNGMMADPSMMEMITNILRATEEEALAMRIPEYEYDGDDVAVAEFISSIGMFGEPEPAPIMEIESVGPTSISVKFQSECTVDTVIYCIRYLKEAGDDDDEKGGVEWKEMRFDAGVTEGSITGLVQNSIYQIYGMYKSSENVIWSEHSEMESITTKKVNKVQFEWDSERKHADIKLRDHSVTAKYKLIPI